jgi:hypothetical protein
MVGLMDRPDSQDSKHYLNLTNGLEALMKYNFTNINVIRIQSTKMELKLTDDVIADLDYDFLLHLALGFRVVVYDFTKHGREKKSRAMWQGLKWVEYVLNKVWFDSETVYEKGMHVFFEERYKQLKKKTRNKIKYFRKFLKTDHLTLEVICDITKNDGNYCYFSSVLDKWLEENL